ncbi:MAG: AraC family transcriptional regulator [Oscillospiraceae bacterium]|nr:AraC family transcriptional regulator [Oscillospiraceae bacterium]MCI9309116.1 AraC family transcriptional regulator [Oscillospiraceae bacterium]MCI9549338.1 AraC family transcriptional regulator [Oscillospiraceae bacterium]
MDDFSFSVFPNDNFLDLRLFQFGWEQCAPLHSFGPFVRNHFLFHYVISGQGYLDADDANGVTRRYDLGPGQGFLICPGLVNTYCADQHDPWKYVWLEFDGLRAAQYLSAAGLSAAQPIYSSKTPAMAQPVEETMLYIANHAKASTLNLIGHLCLFLDALIQSSATRREVWGARLQDFYIQEAVTFMEHNYQRELTVEEVADACKLNRSYFSKLFRENMGCPPQEFLIRLRLSKAADQMKDTKAPIGEIAAVCGYPNQLHFSRAFKKRYGLSPREWRNQNKGRSPQ